MKKQRHIFIVAWTNKNTLINLSFCVGLNMKNNFFVSQCSGIQWKSVVYLLSLI